MRVISILIMCAAITVSGCGLKTARETEEITPTTKFKYSKSDINSALSASLTLSESVATQCGSVGYSLLNKNKVIQMGASTHYLKFLSTNDSTIVTLESQAKAVIDTCASIKQLKSDIVKQVDNLEQPTIDDNLILTCIGCAGTIKSECEIILSVQNPIRQYFDSLGQCVDKSSPPPNMLDKISGIQKTVISELGILKTRMSECLTKLQQP